MAHRSVCIFVSVLASAAVIVACTRRLPPTVMPAQATPAIAQTSELKRSLTIAPASPAGSAHYFGFGVEYGNFDGGVFGQPRRAPAATYAAAGASWVKFSDIDWGSIVPRSGLRACGGYTWARLDGWVREWQDAGFDIQMVLRSRSPWAVQPAYREDLMGGFGKASTPPKPDQWEAYGQFIRCVVERYDADTKEDMPGLRRPILDYEVESEAGVEIFWQGTAEEYLRLLKLAYDRAKAAEPRVRIIASGLGIGDFFDDGAGPEVWEARLAEMRGRPSSQKDLAPAIDRAREFIELVTQHPEAFDVVELHWLTDYRALPAGVEWIRGEMAKHGYSKPIWAGDATSAINLLVAPAYFPDRPYKSLDRLRLIGVLNNPKDTAYTETERWFRAEQAKLTAKKLVVGMAAGLEGVNFCCLQDWPVVTGFPFQGLTDENQQPRPVLSGYRQVASKLIGYSQIKRLALGKDIQAYEFTIGAKTVTVLWRDDGLRYLPGQREPVVETELSFAGSSARLTRVVTLPVQPEPAVETLPVSGGRLRLKLDSAPVFVEAAD